LDGLVNSCPLLDYVAEVTAPGALQLVDIGCSGGIDRRWRRMGRRLRAIGIDPDLREIERLKGKETNPAITYLNAFAGIGAEHPFSIRRKGRPDFERDPHDRLSTHRYREPGNVKLEALTDKAKRSANLWALALLANPNAPVVVPDYLNSVGVTSLDFLKIDVDGKDFDILNSFDRTLSDLRVLAVGIEVRLWGSHVETDGTFHNVDRFMKAQGFEVFNLSLRRYSTSALPSRFVGRAPGATELGRAHHGDALYVRDLGGGGYDEFAKALAGDKILNLALIFAIFDLPDCAAEVLVRFRNAVTGLGDVDRMLDLLTAQSERSVSGRASYKRHMERFEKHPREFLGTRNPFVRMGRAWKKGYLKWRGRRQLLAMERKGP
jgi:Methyltransferase FkbM domain